MAVVQVAGDARQLTRWLMHEPSECRKLVYYHAGMGHVIVSESGHAGVPPCAVPKSVKVLDITLTNDVDLTLDPMPHVEHLRISGDGTWFIHDNFFAKSASLKRLVIDNCLDVEGEFDISQTGITALRVSETCMGCVVPSTARDVDMWWTDITQSTFSMHPVIRTMVFPNFSCYKDVDFVYTDMWSTIEVLVVDMKILDIVMPMQQIHRKTANGITVYLGMNQGCDEKRIVANLRLTLGSYVSAIVVVHGDDSPRPVFSSEACPGAFKSQGTMTRALKAQCPMATIDYVEHALDVREHFLECVHGQTLR